MGLGLVLAQAVAHAVEHIAPVARRFHVDEIQHDQAADVSQPELPANLLGRLEVHLKQRLVFFLLVVALVPMAAGVHVHRHQRLGLVDDDVSTTGQHHLACIGCLKLARDPEPVEYRLRVGIALHLVQRPFGNAADQFFDPLSLGGIVDDNSLHIFSQKVANRALDQVRFLKNTCAGLLGFNQTGDFFPSLQQDGEIPDEIRLSLPLPRCPDNDPHAFGDVEFAHNFLQSCTLLAVLDLPGNTGLLRVGQQDKIAPRQQDVGRHPRPLGSDRPLGHLYGQLRA